MAMPAQIVAHALGIHDDVRTAVGLAGGEIDTRHGGAGVRERHLGAVPDHAAPFGVIAGVDARIVDDRVDRMVEGVTEGDEPAAFLACGDVECSGDGLGLVGDDADGPSTDRGERRDEVGRPVGVRLEQVAVVDNGANNVADVIGAVGRRRQDLVGVGRGPLDRIGIVIVGGWSSV